MSAASAVALSAALAACGAGGGAAAPTAVPAAPTDAPTAAPAPTEAPTAAPAPTEAPTAAPAPTEAPTAAPATPAPTGPAAPVYADGGAVMARGGIDDITELARVPAGAVGGALAGDDTLLLAYERSIARVRLPGGAPEELVALDMPAMYASFRPTRDGRLIYAAVVNDSSLEFGMGTRIGVYDPAAGTATEVLSAPQVLELLGTSADGQTMIVLPRGQDPAFGLLQLRSLSDGAVLEELQVPGEGFAAVSPDGRWAAVSSRRIPAEGDAVEELLLYDLTARPLAARNVPLPQRGAATAGVWAPDSSRLFFSYGKGNIYMLEGSYGLWGLAPETLEVRQVADVDVTDVRMDGISPGGTVLLRGLTAPDSTLVDTATGATTPTAIPPSAYVLGWLP